VNLRHLEVFCTVVECESFSSAAEQLIMTQPAVSMQVQAVERHFGVQLLERRNRRTVPTEAGRAVHSWACEVLKAEAEVRHYLDGLKHAQSGRIVVGASITIGSHVLPPILSRFKREHGGAEIVVRISERHEVCADILSGAVDCGVLIARDIPSELDLEVLGAEEMVFICAPTHRLARCKLAGVAELRAEPFVLAPSGSGYRRVIDELLAEQGLRDVSVLMELDGADSTKRAVQQGLGISVALRSGVEWELEHGLLKEVATGPRPLVELGLVLHPKRRLSPIIQAFVVYLREQLRAQLRAGEHAGSEEDCDGGSGSAPRRPVGRVAHHR
jgi:DNA-binding transcriptional LysR family regulator